RHRARLAVIYGLAPAPPLAGARFAAGLPELRVPPTEETAAGERPGVLRRGTRGQVVVRPMPRRVA
ncbi:MAG TPA: hypothetical protein VMT18_06230, partial [Planctomycetota bacterium]|nr:hypothetical protein [Planctomycetota bacterium]